MSNRADAELVYDIREAMERIASYLNDLSYEAFTKDIKSQDGAIGASCEPLRRSSSVGSGLPCGPFSCDGAWGGR